MPRTIQLPCVCSAHAARSGEPDWTAYTASILVLPDGEEPTEQQLTAGGYCPACARLGEPPPPEDPPTEGGDPP